MSQGNGNELVAIVCGKCGTQYRVHAPGMMRLHHPACSQLILFPSWSIDERVCPNCKTMNAPVIGNVQVSWVAAEPAKDPSRIIPATLLPPMPPAPK